MKRKTGETKQTEGAAWHGRGKDKMKCVIEKRRKKTKGEEIKNETRKDTNEKRGWMKKEGGEERRRVG